MKLNTDTTLPGLATPRLSQKLTTLAEHMIGYAIEFGIEIDGSFPMRLATIGFANGVLLAIQDPKAAACLEQLLALDSIPAEAELQDLTRSFIEDLKGEADWTSEVNAFLRKRWNAAAEEKTNLDPAVHAQLRLLHGIRAGLVVARESTETAQKIADLTTKLWHENRFLSGCLYAWSDNDWNPRGAPFVEYVGAWYRYGTAEQWAIKKAVGELYLVAKALDDPWSLSFWVETGWHGGRNFVRNHPQDCKALLQEAGTELLKQYLGLYRRTVIGTARPDGEVRVMRAALAYIGEHTDPSLARSHCTGREPRRLALHAYDFAFWMGIFSAHPLPTAAN